MGLQILRYVATATPHLPKLIDVQSLPGCHHRDSDYCLLDDEDSEGIYHLSLPFPKLTRDNTTGGEYIDLTQNPEQFTGYAGPSAWRVWKSIYEENCFGLSEATLSAQTIPETNKRAVLKSSLSPVFEQSYAASEQCLEKRVYYKIISGSCSEFDFSPDVELYYKP